MAEILFVQYPKCGTCVKAKKWLEDNKVDFVSRDITKQNPTVEELKEWIRKSNLPISKFFNTSGKIYRENNLKDKLKTGTEEELLKILSSDGMVVKRPIVVSSNFVLVGFKEDEWAKLK